jgi:hypothetical protein
MLHRKGAALVAASALLACAGLVKAAEPQAQSAIPAGSGMTLDKPVYLADTGPADTSIMGLMDKAGWNKTMGDYGLTIGGWVEGSWTYNARNVQVNPGRVFDFETQDLTLNQLVIYVEKPIDFSKKEGTIGGRMEWMWGADARLIHSNGLFDHYGVNDGPENQFDLTQAYIDVYLGNGLNIRVGKFVTLMGAETINPNSNAFYSHSYLFGFAIPFTHTGGYLTWVANDAWTFDLGVSRGWEQSLEDNNGCAIDVFGRATWTINPKTGTKLLVTGIGGPERAGNTSDYRYVLDAVFMTNIGDNLMLSVNGDLGYEQSAGTDGDDAWWYGVAVYAGYKVSDMITINARGEWFEDPDGARGLGTTGSVYEVTLGLDIHPLASNKNFASLRIRPEIRYDYSEDAFFAGGQKHDQWTAGIDAIFGF